jgi:muramoyltetrapeptide carboxypeptidase
MHRRQFLGSLAAAALVPLPPTSAIAASARRGRLPAPPPVKPRRLAPGDTVALVAPASATFRPVELEIARESLQALGLEVKVGGHLLDRHGYLAGQDKDRARDINQQFADPSVRAVLPIRGGWGSSRVLPYLDFDVIRRNPKIVVGYSDITALLLAIHAKTGLVTFHGPNGMGRWDEYSVSFFKRLLMQGEAVTFDNPHTRSDRNVLTQTEHRVETISPGKARGRLLGGNLTVLTTIVGSEYLPSWEDAIFFTEDVDEGYYRIDRMFTQLKLAGILSKIRGFVFGTCAECPAGEGFGNLTLEEIFADHIEPLRVPAWSGAMIGHQTPQWTLPIGLDVEIDADKGTISMTEGAVS